MSVLLRTESLRQLVAAATKDWATAGPLQLEAAFCLRALLVELTAKGSETADEKEEVSAARATPCPEGCVWPAPL
jgi:hypothetical protein